MYCFDTHTSPDQANLQTFVEGTVDSFRDIIPQGPPQIGAFLFAARYTEPDVFCAELAGNCPETLLDQTVPALLAKQGFQMAVFVTINWYAPLPVQIGPAGLVSIIGADQEGNLAFRGIRLSTRNNIPRVDGGETGSSQWMGEGQHHPIETALYKALTQ
jgi:hypothetical protein